MFGINKNKIKLSNIGMGALEIELLFDGLNAEEQRYITNRAQHHVKNGYDVPLAVKSAQTDLILKEHLTQ